MMVRKRKYRLPGEPEFDDEGRRIRLRQPTDLKDRLCEAQNHKCPLCGVNFNDPRDLRRKWINGKLANQHPTFEHVVPFAAGGADDESNLVITCAYCNFNRENGHHDRQG